MSKKEQFNIEQPSNFSEKAKELHRAIVALPDFMGEDRLRLALHEIGKAMAETATIALKALENDRGDALVAAYFRQTDANAKANSGRARSCLISRRCR